MSTDDPVPELAQTFRLLGDPTRLAILLACLAEPRPVGELAAGLGLTPSLVSHHLRLLRTARLLAATRRGKQVFHAAADRHIADMLTAMLDHQAEDRHAA
ncbi:MAG: helix-turn-helix transcriptional regulator [Alphaproteobacteria bacterium]|nr:helix-turn-helix transcriptional regulator [Alphaproteobacteria bacterium]